ncbi:MAG: hypothetical protein WA160_04770 [Pseudobdellovibrio sp.]
MSWKKRFRTKFKGASKKIARFFVQNLLPKWMLHSITRNSLNLDYELPDDLIFKVAETQEELEAAFSILHDAYVGEAFIKPRESGLYVSLQHALPSTSTLIAVLKGRVIGTVTLIRDNPLTLPLEKHFDVSSLRNRGARVAEVSSLAVHRDFRRAYGGKVVFPLFAYLYRYAVQCYGLSYFVIAIYPHHTYFYEAIFDFKQVENKIVNDYMGAPATAMYLDLVSLPLNLNILYKDVPKNKNVGKFCLDHSFSQFLFPKRDYVHISDPVMTPEMLDYFFNKKTSLFADMSQIEAQAIVRNYSLPNYRKVLPKVTESSVEFNNRSERFDVKSKGRLLVKGDRGERWINVEILNVSIDGFAAVLDQNIRLGDTFSGNLVIGEFEIVNVTAVPVWKKEDCYYGFKISEASSAWSTFINYLLSDLYKSEKKAA